MSKRRLLVDDFSADVKAKHKTNLLVEVVELLHEIRTDAILSSILRFPWFAIGGAKKDSLRPSGVEAVRPPPANAWHCVRVLMRGALWAVEEVPCESNGSYLTSVWDHSQNLTLEGAWDRVYLKQAHLLGLGSKYEELVVRLAVDLLGSLGCPPAILSESMLEQRHNNGRRDIDRAKARQLFTRASIRHHREVMQAHSSARIAVADLLDLEEEAGDDDAASCVRVGNAMPTVIETAFQKTCGGRSTLLPLPRHAGEAGKGTTNSGMRDQLQKWFQSTDGIAWKQKEMALCASLFDDATDVDRT